MNRTVLALSHLLDSRMDNNGFNRQTTSPSVTVDLSRLITKGNQTASHRFNQKHFRVGTMATRDQTTQILKDGSRNVRMASLIWGTV